MKPWLLLAAALPVLAASQPDDALNAAPQLAAAAGVAQNETAKPDAEGDEPESPGQATGAQAEHARAVKRCKWGCGQKQRTCAGVVAVRRRRCTTDVLEECKQAGCPCSVWLKDLQLEQCQRACTKCSAKKKQEAEYRCDLAQEVKACAKDETDCRKACE